jgi:hypothetical protein
MPTYDEAAQTAARHFVPLQGWSARTVVGTQVDAAGYQAAADMNESQKINVPICHSNNEIWELILHNRVRRSDLRISLDSFFLFEWFPRSPGLFHTSNGRQARRLAQKWIVEFAGGTVVYDPYGKASMLDGGVGTVRFRPIELAGTSYYLMTASSSGTCHEGFPIAVPEEFYNRMIDEIEDHGAVVRNVTGHLRFVPERMRSFFADVRDVPQLYLVVDDVGMPAHARSRRMEELRVSVAVSFVSDYEGVPRMYASYVTFDPSVVTQECRAFSCWGGYILSHGKSHPKGNAHRE